MGRLLAALAFVLLILPTAAVGGQEPVLAGPWSMDQEGYGHIRPKTIFNGGDGSGLLSHIPVIPPPLCEKVLLRERSLKTSANKRQHTGGVSVAVVATESPNPP